MISSLPTIAKAAEQIRAGEIQPLDLVEYCLSRIDQLEGRIHAWVLIDADGARQKAERQADLFRNGIDPGPLAGIPIGIKDIIDVAGWPTKAGSPLRENHVAKVDAPLVANLRAAGAIILGKTVTTQFACFDPPPTRNPWNLDHTPGGSSSGSAAAVALEMCMAAIGTQTGGSIIRPASYCGVAGLKPTFGHVPLDGVVPVSKSLDHAGPIARYVRDLSIIYPVATGSDAILQAFPRLQRICKSLAIAKLDTSTSIAASLAECFSGIPSRPSVHAIEGFYFEKASRDIESVTRNALTKIQSAWSEERTLELPASFDDVHASHYRIMAYEAAEYHRREFTANPSAFGPNISSLLNVGLDTSPSDYQTAQEHQHTFQANVHQMLAGDSIAVMPSTNTTAPGLETTGDPKFNSPWSYAGVPSITIPCGLASDGMPCGLQLVGPRHSEARLLQAAAWCEQEIDFQLQPPLLPN